MNLRKLPKLLNLKNEASRNASFTGIYSRETMPRLAESVLSINSDIEVDFNCEYDILQLVVAQGTARVKVSLTCMRCYEPYEYEIVTPFKFTPVASDDLAKDLSDDYIPLQFDEFGEVDFLQAIEDELIVSLPLNPMEAYEDCKFGEDLKDDGEYSFGDDISEQNSAKSEVSKDNPFKILEQLKNNFK